MQSSSVHDTSISRLDEFKERFHNPQSTIPYTTDKTLQQRAEYNTEAVYTHCCGHNFTLAVVSTCKLSVIRNVLGKVQEATQMFIKGSKKLKLLEEVVKQNPHYSSEKVIFNVCVTRQVENLDGYNHFLLTYPHIIEALEVIAHKLHLEKYLNWSNWDNESRRRAASALPGISNFEFCVVFTTIVKLLFYLRGPTKKIQGSSLDLYNVVGQVMVTLDDLVFARSDREIFFFSHVFSNMHQKFLVL